MTSAECRLNARGKTAGLFGAVVAVASSLVVVLGLVSTPMASATPFRTHSVGGAAKSSIVSPHTPTDSAAPLNLVVFEAYIGDADPVVSQEAPNQVNYYPWQRVHSWAADLAQGESSR